MHRTLNTLKQSVPLIMSPKHPYIADRVEEGIIRSLYHYRRTPYSVSSDHLLIKILEQIGLSYETNDRLYYHEVEQRTSRIAAAVGFTDYNHCAGVSEKNAFFDAHIKEMVVSVSNGYTEAISLEGLWQFFSPVQVMYHPYTDITFIPRIGKTPNEIEGYAVIRIDIPLLALQYQKWYQWAKQHYEIVPPISQFVYQYPLINMMRSDINMSYFNQIASYSVGVPITPPKRIPGLVLPEWESNVKDDIAYILDHNRIKSRNVQVLSQAIMLMNGQTVWDATQLPDIPASSLNAGILALGTLPWLATLSQLSFQSGSKDNRYLSTIIQKRYHAARNSGMFRYIRGLDTMTIPRLIEHEVLPYLQ